MDVVWEWSGRWVDVIALALMCVAVCWNLAQGVRYRRKLARMAKPPKETQPQPLISDDSTGAVRPQALVYRGHDMAPTINMGDKVWYDPAIQVIDGDGLYVLMPAGTLIVRRLMPEGRGRVRVISDSPNKTLYPSQIYASDELSMLNIVGRVVGWKDECRYAAYDLT